jgi:hypothetical protein
LQFFFRCACFRCPSPPARKRRVHPREGRIPWKSAGQPQPSWRTQRRHIVSTTQPGAGGRPRSRPAAQGSIATAWPSWEDSITPPRCLNQVTWACGIAADGPLVESWNRRGGAAAGRAVPDIRQRGVDREGTPEARNKCTPCFSSVVRPGLACAAKYAPRWNRNGKGAV